MSTNVANSMEIECLATYGTLRDDDNSGATWTKKFIQGVSRAVTGRLAEYRLYGHPTIRYPFAVHSGDPSDTIVVRLLSWPSKEQFAQKIIEADIIEGKEYDRQIVQVATDGGIVPAYIYISKLKVLDEQWTVIPSGDWLQRHVK